MKRLVRVLPWALFALVIAAWTVGLVYDQWSDEQTSPASVAWGTSFLAFPIVGVFLASRIPSNAVGWLFLIGPTLVGAGVSAAEVGQAIDSPTVEAWSDLLLLGLLVLFASLVLFPDGHYPGRWFLIAHLSLLVALLVAGRLFDDDSSVTGLVVVANLLLPVTAMVYRAVRGDSTIRRQIAGPVLVIVVGLAAMLIVVNLSAPEDEWSTIITIMLLTVGTPVSIAISITKYRLYEIDRIISRTVSYAIVVAVLAGAFVGLVALVTSLLPAQSDLAVAASTLAVAALFNPLRRRIQRWVDRRFNRSRYDTQQVMDRFVQSLRDRVDLADVVSGWVDVVAETMHPTASGIWIKEGV